MKKKLHLAAFLIMFSVMVSAQSLLTEDFSDGTMPPSGWTIDAHSANWYNESTHNAGGTAPEALFYYAPSFVDVSRLISPVLNTEGYTSLTLSFNHFLDDYAGTGYSLGVATRSAGGSWNDVWTVSPTGNIGPVLKVLEISNSDVGADDFQFCIYFDGDSYNLDFWYIDDINLTVSVNDDIALTNIDIPRFSLGFDLDVSGSVLNMGLDNITSFDIYYQIGDDEPVMQNFSTMNLSLGDSYDFTCTDQLDLNPGDYMIRMWTANANGKGPDEVPSNDTSLLDLHVASTFVGRRPLFEEFTSSTCNPCATFNLNTFNDFCEQHADEITLVKYQMYWPTPGDPYYTEEGGVRKDFYGVGYVPDLYTDGMQTPTTSPGINNALNNSLLTPAFMNLSASHVIEGTNITVHMDIMPYISGEVVVYIVVFEYVTTGNVMTNGETEFHHVMMKMLPDAYGTTVNLTDGVDTGLEYSADMSSTNVEEMDDLGVAIFVQEASSKILFQSVYSTPSMVGIGDVPDQKELNVYPNPSNGMIRFSNTIEKADISVLNIMGQKITGISGYSGNVIDLTDLPAGNYFLQIEGNDLHTVKAVSIIK